MMMCAVKTTGKMSVLKAGQENNGLEYSIDLMTVVSARFS